MPEKTVKTGTRAVRIDPRELELIEQFEATLKRRDVGRMDRENAEGELGIKMCDAARNGVVPLIERLRKAGAPLNARYKDTSGKAPIHEAAANNKVEALKALVRLGANIEMEALPETVARFYEDFPADQARESVIHDARTSMAAIGDTALIYAAKRGHVKAVKVLLELGANPDHANSYGWTPLQCAK
ncbi:MAG: ankyrin repeat domain-containing protein, partial [Candidatus Altiarchaeota archaeon]